MDNLKTQFVSETQALPSEWQAQALEDFALACLSREASLLGRKEVLSGKAKFGIFGDGKELAQVAMARCFEAGDFRSGYYRDQTFMFAAGLANVQAFFAQLYAHADPEHEPFSAGRQMNAHFATPLIDEQGQWLVASESKNVSADISPTAGQMARALGLALASKQYRALGQTIAQAPNFSKSGREISFCTIGDASTSEGVFWETLNAAAVQQVPLAVFVWDDGYGISVPIEYQTTKGSISEALAGFQGPEGLAIYTVKAWDYLSLRQTFAQALAKVRETHQPCLFHVQEVTQPQGHSTSGSHERYKSAERLQWEKDFDGISRMRQWLLEQNLADAATLDNIAKEAKKQVRQAAKQAWEAFSQPILQQRQKALDLLQALNQPRLADLITDLQKNPSPIYRDVLKTCRQALFLLQGQSSDPALKALGEFSQALQIWGKLTYTTHLYSEVQDSALEVPAQPPIYAPDAPQLNGFELLNRYFDLAFEQRPELLAFGEDVGKIGDVNQGFMNLQAKYGEARIFDTGIREWTIVGQAIGLAMRGFRPIAEIQYLDYLLYALSPLSDDLASLRYRSFGRQKAPAIIRTRGHRLEGIWHSGSPIGMMLHSLRGIYLLTPRDMTRAIGFYNTLLQSGEPGIVIECLNGYRLKETLPQNLDTLSLPLGQVEILQQGTDLTLLTYGSCVRIAQEALKLLETWGISVELIDAQSLLPFDLAGDCLQSLRKTNRLVVLDEDVPGGASAYLLDAVLVKQGGYRYLDSAPQTLTAKAVRPAYGSDGDYFIKPSAEDVAEAIYDLMHEAKPSLFPKF